MRCPPGDFTFCVTGLRGRRSASLLMRITGSSGGKINPLQHNWVTFCNFKAFLKVSDEKVFVVASCRYAKKQVFSWFFSLACPFIGDNAVLGTSQYFLHLKPFFVIQ